MKYGVEIAIRENELAELSFEIEDYTEIIPQKIDNQQKTKSFTNENDNGNLEENMDNQNLEFSYLPGYIDNINSLTTGSISLNGITYNNEILYNNKPLLSVYQCRQTYNFLKRKLPYERPFIFRQSSL